MARRRVLAAATLVALTAACSSADVGLGPTAGSPADDTGEELVERLEATDGVVEVDFEPATGESDSGEPGNPAEMTVEMDADADAARVAAVLGIIRAQGRVPGAEVTVGPGGAAVVGVDDGASVERGAEVLLAARDLVEERSWEPGVVDVFLDAPVDGPEGGTDRASVPSLRLTLPTDDVAAFTDVAETLAADPVFDDVRVSLYAPLPDSLDPSITTAAAGVTDDVLSRWADVRAAVRPAPEGIALVPSYDVAQRYGGESLGAALVLDEAVDRRAVTVEAYGDAVRPALCALVREARQGTPGSTVSLAYDGGVLVDVTVDGPNPAGSYGRPEWNRLARGCPGP